MPTTEERAPAPDPRVVLYVRAGCHLCVDALDVVQRVCTETGVPWVTQDVDDLFSQGPAGRALGEVYSDLVPVVVVDGVRRGYLHLDADRLRGALLVGATGS